MSFETVLRGVQRERKFYSIFGFGVVYLWLSYCKLSVYSYGGVAVLMVDSRGRVTVSFNFGTVYRTPSSKLSVDDDVTQRVISSWSPVLEEPSVLS